MAVLLRAAGYPARARRREGSHGSVRRRPPGVVPGPEAHRQGEGEQLTAEIGQSSTRCRRGFATRSPLMTVTEPERSTEQRTASAPPPTPLPPGPGIELPE